MPFALPVVGASRETRPAGDALEMAARDAEALFADYLDVPPAPAYPSPSDASASLTPLDVAPHQAEAKGARLWVPKRVTFTPDALTLPWGQHILSRVEQLGLEVEKLPTNRLTGVKGEDERDTYKRAKSTLAVVVAPPSQLRLQPIPPSADWQFHLAEGCPAHCQYCYLAGSLSGPPVIRAFANLPDILENTRKYEKSDGPVQSFEVSCYTDPLGLEHLTGSLSECIRHFGTRPNARLRWVSKFDNVNGLIGIEHNGHTRCRLSVNAPSVSRRFEGGTATVSQRLAALRKLALPREQSGGGYPVGIVLAPIMPFPDWETEYGQLLDEIAQALNFDCDLTFELITHRFTPGSKEVLQGWYPATQLDLSETNRDIKRNKFGGTKYVYTKATMSDLKRYFEGEVARRFPKARILYFT